MKAVRPSKLGFPGLVLVAAAMSGCGNMMMGPPTNVAAYQKLRQANPQDYRPDTILLFNMSRMLDPALAVPDRVSSLQLVVTLNGEEPGVRQEVAGMLSDRDVPQQLQQAAMEFLLKRDYPDVAGYVVPALSDPKTTPSLREAILDWLGRHPSPAVLAEVVKVWSQEPGPAGANEERYRAVVAKLTGRTWDEALLDGMNTEEFNARGAAMEILAQRMTVQSLRERLLALTPRSEAIVALRAFMEKLDYMPTNGSELLAAVYVYKLHPEMLDDAVRLARKWQADYRYSFNIRDYHLMTRLSRDPLRTMRTRNELIGELRKSLATREHVRGQAAMAGGSYGESFDRNADGLAISDLWNIYLLNELLSRPAVQVALGVMAAGDREDRKSAWGGLVFYENGQAEAKLYPASTQAGENDLTYVPTMRLILDGRDSLCRFSAHFEKEDNRDRAGPTEEELQNAKRNGYCGLVLTSVGQDHFCAHYYNASGQVVSLGVFPMKR